MLSHQTMTKRSGLTSKWEWHKCPFLTADDSDDGPNDSILMMDQMLKLVERQHEEDR